ncbi:hypothetical protein HY643_02595 [Candidatus Woesearchaeota archaeon]|nr:hypothetical protein [Candidatus Woesearchaeota archaeon]
MEVRLIEEDYKKFFEKYAKKVVRSEQAGHDKVLADLIWSCVEFLKICEENRNKRYAGKIFLKGAGEEIAKRISYTKNDLEKLCRNLYQLEVMGVKRLNSSISPYLSALIQKIANPEEQFNLNFLSYESRLEEFGIGLKGVKLDVKGFFGKNFMREAQNCKIGLIGSAGNTPLLRIKDCYVKVEGKLGSWVGILAEGSVIEIYGKYHSISKKIRNTTIYHNDVLIKREGETIF